MKLRGPKIDGNRAVMAALVLGKFCLLLLAETCDAGVWSDDANPDLRRGAISTSARLTAAG